MSLPPPQGWSLAAAADQAPHNPDIPQPQKHGEQAVGQGAADDPVQVVQPVAQDRRPGGQRQHRRANAQCQVRQVEVVLEPQGSHGGQQRHRGQGRSRQPAAAGARSRGRGETPPATRPRRPAKPGRQRRRPAAMSSSPRRRNGTASGFSMVTPDTAVPGERPRPAATSCRGRGNPGPPAPARRG